MPPPNAIAILSNARAEVALKVAIFLLLATGIYLQVLNKQDSGYFTQQSFDDINRGVWIFLMPAILLVAANWGIEAYKWRLLMSRVDNITYLHSVKSVLAGASLAIFTPYRLGEYGGRMLLIREGYRLKSAVATIAGNISQYIVNVGIGFIFTIIFFNAYFTLGLSFGTLLLPVFLSGLVLVAVIYLMFPRLIIFLKKFRITVKIRRYAGFLRRYNRKEISSLMLLSFFRYTIYVVQYLLLIHAFGINIGNAESIVIINVLFFMQSIIPSVALADIGIRGNLALALFGLFTNQPVAVLSASLFLWAINLLAPALAGYLVVLQTRVLKN